jgi:hypothetical protein
MSGPVPLTLFLSSAFFLAKRVKLSQKTYLLLSNAHLAKITRAPYLVRLQIYFHLTLMPHVWGHTILSKISQKVIK